MLPSSNSDGLLAKVSDLPKEISRQSIFSGDLFGMETLGSAAKFGGYLYHMGYATPYGPGASIAQVEAASTVAIVESFKRIPTRIGVKVDTERNISSQFSMRRIRSIRSQNALMEERAPIVFANQNLAAAGGTSLATSINWKAGVLRSSAALYQDAESRLAGIEDTSERKVDGVGASGLSGNTTTPLNSHFSIGCRGFQSFIH